MKFLTLFVTVIFLAGCGSRSSDDEQVRALIAAVEEAAEARDTSDVLAHVSESYAGERGDKAQLRHTLRGYFLAYPKIELLVDVESLEFPVPGLAQGVVDITSLPAGHHLKLDVEFRKNDGRWLAVRADRARD
jgi:hypothetical protein